VRHRTDQAWIFDYIVFKVSSRRLSEARWALLHRTGLSIEAGTKQSLFTYIWRINHEQN
jgi:hypothetical protein